MKKIFERKSKNDFYLISYFWQREEHYIAITNDLAKWLEQNNSERDEESQETLGMFNIKQIATHIFKEEEK